VKVAKAPALYEGDSVEVSVTHEVKIGKETSWIKYGVHTKVQSGETEEAARNRAAELTASGALKVVEKTVKSVQSYNEER
jgi:hypothetical protein